MIPADRHGLTRVLARTSLLGVLVLPALARADDPQPNGVQPATDGGATAPPPVPTPAATRPPPPPPPARPNSTWYKDTLGDTFLLLAVGSVVAGSAFLAAANSTATAAASGADAGWASRTSTARTESIVGGVFIGVGVALFASAQWRYFTVSTRGNVDEAPDPPNSPAVGLSVQHNGFALSYGATF
jgi:hypothetical protein